MGFDNVVKPEKSATVGSTAIINLSFVDDTGAPASPASATWSLYNFLDGSLINGRHDVAVVGLPAPTATVELTPADNVVVDPSMALEEHRLLVIYPYGAEPRIGKVQVQIVVENAVGS